MKKIIFSSLIIVSFFIFNAVEAVEFDYNYLISDTEITDYEAMNLNDITRFLDRQPGTLDKYVTEDKEGNSKTAAETFYETANTWLINPKYLMVLVQKEQSLLTATSPKQTQYDWATGYGCPDGGGCNTRWQGFYRQVNSAAAQTRYYMDNIHEFHYQPGKTYTIDNYQVTPENTATAGLYSYTPHVDCGGSCGGNKLFWDLWNKYFGKKWPDGSLLQATGDSSVFYIENGTKKEITSKSVLLSRFNPSKIIEVSKEDLDYYEDGSSIKYHNFSLLRDKSRNIYMIVDDKLRKFKDEEVFKKIGFMEDEIIDVSNADIAGYEMGPDISKYTIYPDGKLLQDSKTKKIYYVLSGVKREVVNNEILKFNFQGLAVEKTDESELDKYRSASPVTLPDGELIKTANKNTVYVISEGKRLPIFNSNVFQKMKYKWSNIIVVSKGTLAVHPLGQTITGDW